MPCLFDFLTLLEFCLDNLSLLETLLESDVVGMARGYRARCDSAPNHFFPLTFSHLFFFLTCNLLASPLNGQMERLKRMFGGSAEGGDAKDAKK